MQPAYKDIEIDSVEYQIGQFTARVGSWVLLQVLTKMMPMPVPSELNGSQGLGRVPVSEDEFGVLQAHCLSVCRRYENKMPMPIFIYPNRWAVKDLEYDLVTVMALTVHSLVFNLGPFFAKGGMDRLSAAIQDLNPLPSALSMDSSSAPS